ncbi:MAG: hypothetical protein AAF700_06215 [Pseudomonadota bacterium]
MTRRIIRLGCASLLMLVAACGRPLSEGEEAFARAFHGPGLDTSKIKVIRNPLIKLYVATVPYPPRTTCSENIHPPPKETHFTGSPGATVLFNKITINPDAMAADYLPSWPKAANLRAAMFMAHEFVHVWQWQNRERTKYHPLKAAREHRWKEDPYLFDLDTNNRFLDYAYEQQGAIAAEYICCAALAPKAPRTERLRALLAQEFPIDQLHRTLPQTPVLIPWKGADLDRICS